jgi:hypothetical protein
MLSHSMLARRHWLLQSNSGLNQKQVRRGAWLHSLLAKASANGAVSTEVTVAF